jgi:signal transduction histidine kinase
MGEVLYACSTRGTWSALGDTPRHSRLRRRTAIRTNERIWSATYAHLGPATVAGDAMLMERLITNLVDNAVRYNVPDCDVWLNASTVDGQVRITVANTGPVVPADGVGTLFESFD